MEDKRVVYHEVLSEGVRRATNTRTRIIRHTLGDDSLRYYVECVDHAEEAEVAHRAAADEASRRPYRFCSQCAEESGMTLPEDEVAPVGSANAGMCDACGGYHTPTTLFGHIDAPRSRWIRLCKSCQVLARASVESAFAPLIAARRDQWRGMSAKQRRRVAARHVIGDWRRPASEREKVEWADAPE